MGKPAARLGDMTMHGGAITGPGVPNVLIGKMPAATLGDMHMCPMVTPATPPVPHVGGPITLGSTGVIIGKKPAARMGDMAVCVGPPSSITMGCMTVLIGEVGGGGSGGGGGGGGGAGGGSTSAANASKISATIAGEEPQSEEHEVHSLHALFVDKTKTVIGGMKYHIDYKKGEMAGMLAGDIKKGGVDQGSYDVTLRGITSVEWSVPKMKVGDSVDMIAKVIGVKSGEKAVFTVYVRDGNYSDYELATIKETVSGDEVKASWTFEVDERFEEIAAKKGEKKRYSQPFFFFKVSINDLFEQSGMLYAEDWIEIELYDEENKPIPNEQFKLISGSGEIIEGELDSEGKKKIENVSPGISNVQFPERNDV